MMKNQPPKLFEKLFAIVSVNSETENLSGDFREQFAQTVVESGYIRALFWYVFQILKLLLPNLQFKMRRRIAMFRNYVKIALRNLIKHKNYTLINVCGLAVGLTSFMLITLFVLDELSYDSFHENADNIYRVAVDEFTNTSREIYALSPQILAPTMKVEFPEVISSGRISTTRSYTTKYEDKIFDEPKVALADTGFFSMFVKSFIKGDPREAVINSGSVILTESIAEKYFGEDDPLGKVMTINNRAFNVTGVIDNLPHNSHFDYEILIPLNFGGTGWTGFSIYSYIELRADASPAALEAKLPDFFTKHVGAAIEDFERYLANGNGMNFIMQPLQDIHLHSDLTWEIEPNGSAETVYLFIVVAGLILLIACINFMNLTTSKSIGRAKEVGIRKVVGSIRRQLISQFLLESIILSAASMMVGLALLILALPMFNELTGKSLTGNVFLSGNNIALLAALTMVLGVLAGSYPAFYLSAFRPIAVLKNKILSKHSKKFVLNGLVVVQFSISTGLIVSTLVINNQMDFMISKDLGFEKEGILLVEKAGSLGDKLDIFKESLTANSEITGISNSSTYPGRTHSEKFFTSATDPSATLYNMSLIEADQDFVSTYGLEIINGRNFSDERKADSTAVLVNEAAVAIYGWKDIENKQVSLGNQAKFSVVGVVKDYHFRSLERKIDPLIIMNGSGRYLSVRFKTNDIQGLINMVRSEFESLTDGEFFKYSFLDDNYEALYDAERRAYEVFTLFSGLAIFIACLGLFGLVSFSAEQRTKEIGIRKVLGASESGIYLLMSKDFISLIMVSFIATLPVVYYGVNNWLDNYAYRINFPYENFFYAGLMIVCITILTVSYQAFKTAFTNPVDVLRYE